MATDNHGKRDDTEPVAAQVDLFLRLLLGLAPATPDISTASPGRGESLPDGGKALPPSLPAGLQELSLKSVSDLSLADLMTLSAGREKGESGLSERLRAVLQRLSADQLASVGKPGDIPPDARARASVPAVPVALAHSPPGLPATGASLPPAAAPPLPMASPHFGEALASRVQWIANNGLQFARIDVSPAHLGPLEIHIHLDGDKAQVAFGAHHAVAREALEAAIPRLRVLLGDSGLQLVQVDVGQQGMTDDGQRESGAMPGGGSMGGPGIGPAPVGESAIAPAVLRRGLVDDYA